MRFELRNGWAARARALATAAAVLVVALPAGDAGAAAPKPAEGDVVPGRYIVVYEESVAAADAETGRNERALGFKAKLRFHRAIKGFSASLTPFQVSKLRADPQVAFVTPDRRVRALGAVPVAAGDAAPTGVRRIEAAASGAWAHEASDVAVAVLDSGVDLRHPDLNAANGTNCVTPGTPAQDENGHGSHVAGTIGAKNNGAGVVGVAPGTRVYAVKVLDAAGNGAWSNVVCGLDWVTANAAALDIKIANLSLGGLGSNDNACGTTDGDVLHAAVCRATRAGVLHVVAAGNDGWDLGDSPPDVPASYPEVLAVTAFADSDGLPAGRGGAPSCKTDEADDSAARFSNFATRPADIAHMVAAPGVCIVSTWPGGGYETLSGTSMAAPHVAGLAALCLGEGGVAGPCAGKTPAEIIGKIRADAASYSTASPGYGFAGDPLRSNQWSEYFGYAARAPQDRTAPGARLVSQPAAAIRATSATVAFTAAAGARFECRLDGGAWAPCSSPTTVGGLGEGSHAFEVRATDVVGNVDASPARAAFAVDTTPPTARITSGPADPTTDQTPTFELAASEPGALLECRVDARAWSSCASPHRVAALDDGRHVFELRATDAVGNVSGVVGWPFTVDTTTTTLPAPSPDPTPPAPTPQPTHPAAPAPAPPASPATEPTLPPPPAPVVPALPVVPVVPADTTAPALAIAWARQRLAAVRAGGVRAAVSLSETSALSARLVLDGRTAKRLGLSRGAPVVVGRAALAAPAGRRAIVVRLTARARARLAAVRSVVLTLRVTATDGARNARTASRRLTVSR